MAVSSTNQTKGELLLTLTLFAFSAKLWITLQNNRPSSAQQRKRRRCSDTSRAHNNQSDLHCRSSRRSSAAAQHRHHTVEAFKRRSRRSAHSARNNFLSPPSSRALNHLQQQKRQESQFTSTDDFGVFFRDTNEDTNWEEDEHDEGINSVRVDGQAQQTQSSSVDIKQQLKRSTAEDPDWRRLMERISIADSVLTRETSLDFHPKNSNWSHFEGYTIPSPTARVNDHDVLSPVGENPENTTKHGNTSEEEDGEDFLWSEPPSSGFKDAAIHIRNTFTRMVGGGGDDAAEAAAEDSDIRCSLQQSATVESFEYMDNALQSQPTVKRSSTNDIREFNAGIMPSKLILVRHGQSEGNVNEELYATKPDNAMRLTKLGWEMARMCGKALRTQLPPGETVHFVVSPYSRTVETFHGIASAWSDPEEFANITNRNKRLRAWYSKLMEMGLTWHEDPRIREQDFGNYQDPEIIKRCKSERHKFGSFYYRFPHGESASDVVSAWRVGLLKSVIHATNA
eukprot:scaffold1851_cov172-Alexandrium_tamarense.AAC.14